MTDMRNVNNWHWVNKDCRVWANEYFRERLVGLTAEKNKTKVTITSIDQFEGDVDLNQRKGKLIAIYDIALKLSWKGDLSDGSSAFGTIEVPEVAYDTEYDDYVFNINVNQGQDEIKKFIRTELTPLLRDKFFKFTHDLISRHSADLYADKDSTPSTPELKQRKPASNQPITSETKKEETVIHTSQIEHSYDFKGINARDVYEALLDPRRADIWSHGKTKLSKRMGSDFQLFDGNIHGTLLKATPYKSILQTWRFKSWPKEHYSTVTLTFNEIDNGVQVHVNQLGVPLGQEEVIRANWMRYYWNPIKDSYNRGQLQDIPYESSGYSYNVYLALIIGVLVIALTAYQVAPYSRF